MRTILHISDIHFGPPHLPRLSAAVLALCEERRPSLVVISGDLTQRALPAQFREARAFVDRLPAPALVVPGNHDVPFHQPLLRLWRRFLEPYGEYQRYFARELEPVYTDDELAVVGINTAHGWTIQGGRLPVRRLAEVTAIFRQAPPGACRIVAAHHPLVPPPDRDGRGVLRRADRAIALLAQAGVELVLSGHLHQAYQTSSEEVHLQPGPPLILAQSGTTTSSRGRGAERGLNTCNWIVIDEHALILTALLWREEFGSFVERSRHWYPRHVAGAAPAAERTAGPGAS